MDILPIKELTQKVIQNIDKHNLIRTQRIIVGLSGGPDSVCLLHVLWSISERYGFTIYPAHLNHMLRAEEADKDEEFCLEFCKSLGLTLKVWHMDINKLSMERKRSTEEVAREARYSLFSEYADSIGGATIAVAHNMNDQAETLLMRIIRGTGLDGLKGMEFYRDGIIRPLLSVPRSLIEDYNSANSIVPRIDSSNLLTDYTRNKIRLELLPYIKELFEVDAIPALYRLSQICTDDSRLLHIIIEKEYENCIVERNEIFTKLSIQRLNSIPREALGRVIRHSLSGFTQNLKGIENAHIELVKKLVLEGKTGSTIQFPSGIRFYRDYTYVKIFKENKDSKDITDDCYIEFNKEGEYTLPGNIRFFVKYLTMKEFKEEKFKRAPKSLTQYFDLQIVKDGLTFRKRHNGDVFFPYGSTGSKKLKEFLIDEKVQKEKRDELLLLSKGKDIMWIVGMRISGKFKVDDKTIKVVKIEVKL